MARLPVDKVRSLLGACLRCGVERAWLLAGVSPQLTATIPVGHVPMDDLFLVLNALNELTWLDERDHPLLVALHNASYRAEGRPEKLEFEEAIAYLTDRSTVVDPARKRVVLGVFNRKVKAAYLGLGYHLIPPIDGQDGPFVAIHPDGRMAVVAVSYRDSSDLRSNVENTIVLVHDWLKDLRAGGDVVEGYVVLAPVALDGDRDEVIRAGLHPLDYRKRLQIAHESLDTLVRCQIGELSFVYARAARDQHEPGAVTMEGLLAPHVEGFLKHPPASVALFLPPQARRASKCADDIFRLCAGHFLKQVAPAPLQVGAGWEKRSLVECACDVFARYRLPAAPVMLEPLLREGAVCPILVREADSPSAPDVDLRLIPRILETTSERSKAIVVFENGDADAAQRVEISLRAAGCHVRLIHAAA